MEYVDTHFHLDLMSDPYGLAKEIEHSKIYTIAVTNTPSVFKFSFELTQDKKYIRAALGLHPELVYQRAGELLLFKEYIKLTSYIGEIGLDFSRNHLASKGQQIKIFENIIQLCADDGNKCLTVHSRKAEKEVVEIIGKDFPGKVILHWYSGSLKTLEKALDFGYYFSVNYKMTKSENGLKIINAIPTDRLLTESDGPFIEVNGVMSNPKTVTDTCNELNRLFKHKSEDFKSTVFQNFSTIINSINRK